jgi:hypothetical protein
MENLSTKHGTYIGQVSLKVLPMEEVSKTITLDVQLKEPGSRVGPRGKHYSKPQNSSFK